MHESIDHDPRIPTFAELFPEIPEDQRADAEANFREYLVLCARIFERIRRDPVEYARFKELTGFDESPTVKSSTHIA